MNAFSIFSASSIIDLSVTWCQLKCKEKYGWGGSETEKENHSWVGSFSATSPVIFENMWSGTMTRQPALHIYYNIGQTENLYLKPTVWSKTTLSHLEKTEFPSLDRIIYVYLLYQQQLRPKKGEETPQHDKKPRWTSRKRTSRSDSKSKNYCSSSDSVGTQEENYGPP